jgi:hypothetical protein
MSAQHISGVMSSSKLPVDRARVEEIARMTNPAMRNLYITQGYHDLARQMGAIVGEENATWATFGCWASKTAGTFIRHEELPRFVRRMLERHPELAKHSDRIRDETTEVAEGVAHALLNPRRTAASAVARIATHTALYIGEGNRVVFAELAASYADFIHAFGNGDLDEDRLADLLTVYSAGATQPDEIHVDHATHKITSERRGGQDWLMDMLRTLHQAALTDDANRKAELLLLASAYGGMHEQTRLQTYIAAALSTAIDDVLIPQLRLDAAPDAHHHHGPVDWIIIRVGRLVARISRRRVAEWSSRRMMTMPLPDETIRLGEDIRAEKGGDLYPSALVTLSEPALVKIMGRFSRGTFNDRVVRAVARVGARLPGDRPVVFGTAASNWSDFDQRMRLIFAYFRTRQQCEALRQDPFTAAQLEALAVGEMPGGQL